jgi:5-methylcytosine-specific restriction enzyme A
MSKKSLYNYRWAKYSREYLKLNPLCVRCAHFGKATKSEVVDHIIPHRGNYELFWNKENHQPLCKQHHDSYKQRLEKSGTVAGCNSKGIPIDPNHHWNKSKEK